MVSFKPPVLREIRAAADKREELLAATERNLERIGIGAGLAARPLPHTWTPPFCKAFVNDRQMGLRLRPYIRTVEEATATPLSLMESADRALITTSRSKRLWEGRVFRSRSNLSCHHITIAQATSWGALTEPDRITRRLWTARNPTGTQCLA